MFDVGALELVLIGIVALIVVGPERLPKLARTAGLWIGRARRALVTVKDEIDREIKADELKEVLRQQALSNPLETILEEDGKLRPRHPPAGPDSTPEHAGKSAGSRIGGRREAAGSMRSGGPRADDGASR